MRDSWRIGFWMGALRRRPAPLRLQGAFVSAVLFIVFVVASAVAWAQGPSPASSRGLKHVPAPVGPNGQVQELYKGSYALLIGVSKYDHPAVWASLDSIPGELDEVAAALKDAGFDTVERMPNPTGDELRRGVEQFIRRHGYDPSNRLLFFFAGHGYTLDNGTRGYFVARDAPDPDANEARFRGVALPMDLVATWARDMTARHVLFAFDSCFSGTIFRTRDRTVPKRISDLTARPVREFMAAGDAGETVPARSVFTPVFIRGLSGAADLDADGFVTGTELGNFVQREVIAYRTGQTPQFGKLRDPRLDEGDFVFAVRAAPAAADPVVPRSIDPLRSTRWAYAKQPGTESTAWQTTAESVLRNWGIGILFDAGVAGLVWVRSQYDATAAIERGGRVPSPWASSSRGVRAAYIALQTVANTSRLGKDYIGQVQALTAKLAKELQDKNAELKKLQNVLGSGSPLLDARVRGDLASQIKTLQGEIARSETDAKASVDALQQRLQQQFERAFSPLLEQVAQNSELDFVFDAGQSGLVHAIPALDITSVLVKVLDAGQQTTRESVAVPAPRRAAYLDLQRAAAESALGKAYHAQVQSFQRQKQQELNKTRAPDQPRAVDDAEKAVSDLMSSLQSDFQRKMTPVLEQISRTQGYDLVFSKADAGFVVTDPSLDITADVIRALDAAHPGK